MGRRAEGTTRSVEGAAPAGGLEPVVEVVEVTKRFGEVVAVDRVSFSIAQGEFFSLLGPSGCGKTTTLRILAGFERPDAGRVLIDGRDASVLPPHRRDTNMVFQSYALFPHMTVRENVAFGPRRKERRRLLARGEVDRIVREALATVRMEAFADRYPRELSGGQQQRVAIARALANQPEIVWADEPTGNLDTQNAEEVLALMRELNRRNRQTFVIVTHDPRIGAACDRVIRMQDGLIVDDGHALAE